MTFKKVFVTVGTHPQPFNRLLKKIDELVEKKSLKVVLAQIGYSNYVPRNYPCAPFLGIEEFAQKIQEADLIITHGGEGNIGQALQFKKKCIAVPRLKKFGEHTNDHQLELVNALARSNRILMVLDEQELQKTVEMAEQWEAPTFQAGKEIVRLLEEFSTAQFGNRR